MTQEELQKALDELDKGLLGQRKEWEWDRAMRASTLGETYKEQISKTNRKNNYKGYGNHNYGKGDNYKVTTPEGTTFIGAPLDIKEKFGLQPANLREYAQRAKPCTKGKFKGFTFEIVA